jgi:CelD/BcsL family acetyltransferase involved in cellulose biosynthesis
VASTDTDHAPRVALERTASAITSARRAMAAERYPVSSFAVEWRWIADLVPIAEDWRELAGRALEPNVFYEPAFALAAAAVFGDGVGAVLVWSGTQPRRLLGFFPARIVGRRYGLKLPLLLGWTHPYAPLGTPLVDREVAEPVIAAWLAHLCRDQRLPGLLLLPLLTEEGPFAAALGTILRRGQMPCADFDRHRRAMLAPEGNRSGYVERALSRRKRQQLRRFTRRLGEQGEVLFTAATDHSRVIRALEDFLALEAGGWKGRAGTAAAQNEDIHCFVKTALHDLSLEHKARINRVLLDGRPIAAGVILRSGNRAWFWKIAYNETFARYSPGVMLSVALTEQLLEDASIAQTDSCVPGDHPMIDSIWRERLPLCNRMIAVRPEAPFVRARRLETLRGSGAAAAKAIRAWLRGAR